MAEGLLKSFDQGLIVYSAGTSPAHYVHPAAIKVMKEIGIDISDHFTKNVNQFLHKSFDYVITVCDDANESCPIFSGKVEHRLHIGFEDPAKAAGSDEKVLSTFRNVRDEIKKELYDFYMNSLTGKQKQMA